MKEYYKSYGVSASIAVHKDGSATLTTSVNGGKRTRKQYKSRNAAYSAWRRMCA